MDQGYVTAIDMKSGELVWEHGILSPEDHLYFAGGPLVAEGKVILGRLDAAFAVKSMGRGAKRAAAALHALRRSNSAISFNRR